MKYLCILTLILLGCGKHPATILGNWSGQTIRIISAKGDESVDVPIEKYGYLNLSMDHDSTYALSLAVLKDVRVEHKVFGVAASTVLIPAVYKSNRFGRFSHPDSVFVLTSQKDSIFATLSPGGDELNLRFTDNAGRHWLARLEPKD